MEIFPCIVTSIFKRLQEEDTENQSYIIKQIIGILRVYINTVLCKNDM